MRSPVRRTCRARIRQIVGSIALISALFSPVIGATNYYAGPYYTSGIGDSGGSADGNLSSVAEGVNLVLSVYRRSYPNGNPVIVYNDQFAQQTEIAATISDNQNLFYASVWAHAYSNDPNKSAGGCNPWSGGNGGGGGSSPHGGQGEGAQDASMCPGSNFAGDPINLATGNKYEQDTDYRQGPALTFSRFYNSRSQIAAAHMGIRWRHTFDRSLEVYISPASSSGSSQIILSRPDSSRETFRKVGAAWAAPADSVNRITESVNASGVVTGYDLFMGGPHELEHYSVDGVLQYLSDVSGATTTFAYSSAATDHAIAPAAGLLIAVTDASGRSLGFSYDASSRVAAITLPGDGVIRYAYDAAGNLASATYPDGGVRKYFYNESAYVSGSLPNAMTGIVDEKGIRFETTTYDSLGMARSSSFAGGVDKFTMAPGSTVTVTTPLGASSTLNFTPVLGAYHLATSSAACGDACNQPFKARGFDANGFPSSYTDRAGVVTKTSYDANGLLTQQIDASGTAQQRTTSKVWNSVLRVPLKQTLSDSTGAMVAHTEWSYNGRGQVTAECQFDSSSTTQYSCGSQAVSPSGIRQTTYSYCDAVDSVQCPRTGLLLAIDGPRSDVSDVTRYGYYLGTDESGCDLLDGACHRVGDLASVTDSLGHVARVLSYDKSGRVKRRQDANRVIIDLAYTLRGWLASATVRANADGSASAGDATTTWTYDATGTLHDWTDPDGVKLTFAYDDAHRLVDMADASGSHIHYTLDAVGNRLREETFDASGVSRRSVSRKYNSLGQLTSVTDGMGHVVFDATATGSYDSVGNLVNAKDALGISSKDTYDVLGRLIASVANASGTDAATKATTTTFALDALDRLTGVTDPDGLVTTYGFDGLSNPATQKSPDTGTSSATFDASGNAVTRTDAKGTVASQVFDAIGRTVSSSYVDAALNVAYHFDEANSVTGCAVSFPVGRLTRVVETAVTTVYCYDNQGRVTEKRQTQGTVTDRTDYAYTHAGRLAGIASPSGLVTAYGRDTLAQIKSVTVTPVNGATTNVVTAANYLPFGPVASYTLGNGQTLTRTYDANYRVTDVVSPALALHFARDAAGNIRALGDAAGAAPATETYTYDPLYRLTSVNDAAGGVVEAYTYSKTGDRLTKVAPGRATGIYSYQKSTHWLTGIGTASRAYDANGSTTGNVTAGSAWAYGYNGRGELISVQQDGVTVATYSYNFLAQRVGTTVGGAALRFSYGLAGELLTEYGSAARDYIWLDDLPVGAVDVGVQGPSVGYVHADALGSPRAVSNGDGATVWTWAFAANPFGEALPSSSAGYHMNLRYPGQYFDPESGFIYNYHRIYDPSSGRYIQSDPLGLIGGPSGYLYAGGNALSRVDPLGLTDLNLFPRGSAQYSSAQKFISPPGTYVVGAHGNPINIEDQNGTPLYPQGLAALIQQDPAYHPGETVLLLSCNTGVTPPASWHQTGSFAKQLATALQANVQAPDHFGWLSSSGTFESRGALINGQPAAWDKLPIVPVPMTQDPNDSGTLIEVKP